MIIGVPMTHDRRNALHSCVIQPTENASSRRPIDVGGAPRVPQPQKATRLAVKSDVVQSSTADNAIREECGHPYEVAVPCIAIGFLELVSRPGGSEGLRTPEESASVREGDEANGVSRFRSL